MKNILQYATLLVGFALPLYARPSADSAHGQVQHHPIQARSPKGKHYQLQRRVPKPTVESVQVGIWDLAYMDLRLDSGKSKVYKISKDKPEKEKAIGTLEMRTDGLASCSALAIRGSTGALLAHFPPGFCDDLAGVKPIEANWETKKKQMEQRLLDTLKKHKDALSGGRIFIVNGYAASGTPINPTPGTQRDNARRQLQRILDLAGITPRAQFENSVMAANKAARSVVVSRTGGITVDGRTV